MNRLQYLAFYGVAVVVLGVWAWRLQTALPITGDEPHYLVITQSLVADHDLDVRNNYEPAATAAFYSGPLPPHAQPYNEAEKWRSGHNAGLAVLLAPGYAAAGLTGAVLTLLLIYAFAVPEAAGLAVATGAPRRLAFAGAALLFLTPPLALYAGRIYPETVAAPLVVVAVRRAMRLRSDEAPGRLDLVWIALAAAALPWLHVKFAVLSLVILGLVWWQSRRAGLITSAALGASLLGLAGYLWRYYGSPLPNAQYAGDPAGGLSIGVLAYGVPGLLVDQEFGLLFAGPVAAIALVGLLLLARRNLAGTLAIASPLAALWVVSSLHEIWWGGLSFGPRFLVPALPLLVAPLAALLATLAGRLAGGAATVAGLGLTALALLSPETVLNSGSRESRLLLAAGRPGQQLAAALPSFVPPKPGWSDRPLEQMTGNIGETNPDPITPSGVARTSRGASGTLIRYGPIPWRRGDSIIRVTYRTTVVPAGSASGMLRVFAYDSLTGARLMLGERPLGVSDAYGNADLPVRHGGTVLFGAAPSLIIEVESGGIGELIVGGIAWHG